MKNAKIASVSDFVVATVAFAADVQRLCCNTYFWQLIDKILNFTLF